MSSKVWTKTNTHARKFSEKNSSSQFTCLVTVSVVHHRGLKKIVRGKKEEEKNTLLHLFGISVSQLHNYRLINNVVKKSTITEY